MPDPNTYVCQRMRGDQTELTIQAWNAEQALQLANYELTKQEDAVEFIAKILIIRKQIPAAEIDYRIYRIQEGKPRALIGFGRRLPGVAQLIPESAQIIPNIELPLDDDTHHNPGVRTVGKPCAHNGPRYPCQRRANPKKGKYCDTHARRKRLGLLMDSPIKYFRSNKNQKCAHSGPDHPCDRPAVVAGYCHMHYQRQIRGRPMDAPIQVKRQ